ncbi:helix-turn-helix domain-containing protein [Georhizobium sp. MAB10]|uniref:helix-turn-helix domain-containing protein n=1 Tax=Georhizobium sp. MAB10 TaxID=3028319 RepID=UPI003855AD94
MRPPPAKVEFQPKSFSPDKLAARWDCSAAHIRDLVARGELPAFRVGRLIRIPAEAVLAVERCVTPPVAPVDHPAPKIVRPPTRGR